MFNLITANLKIVSYLRSMLLILTIFPLGCVTTSKNTTTNPIAEKNKDVLILASLIRGHLKSTNERGFNLNDLAQNDTLRRISNNFERAELKTRGGYISVYYKFSKSRNAKIELTNKEIDMLKGLKWASIDLTGDYDGEIRFQYGERFYHIKKILVKK